MRRALLLGATSGLLATLAQANPFFEEGLAPVSFIALTPLFLGWLASKTQQQSCGVGLSYALFATLGQSFWLASPHTSSALILMSVTIGYLLYFTLFSYLIWHLTQSSLPLKPLLLAAVWTFYEVAKSTGPLAHPWGLIAHPLHTWIPLIQIVDTLGVFGFGFWIALVNSLLATRILAKDIPLSRKLTLATLGTFAIFTLYGSYSLTVIPQPTFILPVLMVQTNKDPWEGSKGKQALKRTLELSEKGLREHPQTELVLWSETLLKELYYSSSHTYPPQEESLHNVLSRYPVHWLIGAPAFRKETLPSLHKQGLAQLVSNYPLLSQDPHKLTPKEWIQWWSNLPSPRLPYNPTNAILHIRPSGHVHNTYSKRRLIPFVENLPFLEILPINWLYHWIGTRALWAEGQEVGIFDVVTRSGDLLKLGSLICFEDAFDLLSQETVRAGADLLVNLTNDLWSKTRTMPWQHHIIAKFRTIESRRTLVRSTNGGVTSIVDAWGRTLAILPIFESQNLFYRVPIYNTITTAYTRLGDWFISLIAILFSGVVIHHHKPSWLNRRRQSL